MSDVIVGKILKGGKGKNVLQPCDLGGSLYGKASSSEQRGTRRPEENKDLTSSYKSFYRSQVDIMNKVFGKNTK
jgi:Na+-translocating ferredoxin:NAD+ oxidoreductase RnfD subunit